MLTATSNSLKPATSNSFNITAGAASQLVATSGNNQTATVSTDFAHPLVATVEDANGNPLLTSGTSVTFTAPTGSKAASATFTDCSARTCAETTNASGQATAPFHANANVGSYPITASSGTLTSATFTEANTPSVKISNLSSANGAGGTAGKLDAGDSVTATFSGQIDASTVCSDWTNGSTGVQSASGTVTITGGGSGNDNGLAFAPAGSCSTSFNFGTLSLGNAKYYVPGSSGGLSFTGSTIAYDGTNDTLTITLGTEDLTGGTQNTVTSSNLKLTLSPSILDTNDHALNSYTVSSGGDQQF